VYFGVCFALVACTGTTPGGKVEAPKSAAVVTAPSAVVSSPRDEAHAAAPVDTALLAAWSARVGGRRAREPFGTLLARVAAAQLGVPYRQAPEGSGPEWVHTDLTTFHCVSLVETSLALTRCLWRERDDAACLLGEIEGLRYRGGRLDGFASRLHYFVDWLEDNAARRHLVLRTRELGGRSIQLPFFYLSAHPTRYPPMAEDAVRALVERREEELGRATHDIIPRERVGAAVAALRTGDVVAIVGAKPGILVSHTGLVVRGKDGVARLLHASSHHHRVLLTTSDLADYVRRRPERRGLIVARPLEPEP